jgi:hypothetical protein
MTHRAMLDDLNKVDLCASFQPNSVMRQERAGLTGLSLGGFTMPVFLRPGGIFEPSGCDFMTDMGMKPRNSHTSPTVGLGVLEVKRPERRMAHWIRDSYRNGKTGLLSTFNSIYSGSHSRRDDWPLCKADVAPPRERKREKPGGPTP